MANVAYSEPSRTKMIVGAIINQPDLLDTDEAQRLEDFDFTDPLHRMVYFTVHNLYQEGHSKINGALIDQYLSVRPRMYEYFNENEGYEFVNEAVEIGAPTSFKPNVERVKKLSLLRGLSGIGVDVSFIYDWQTEDQSAFQKQSDNVDRMSVLELGSLISDRIDSIIDDASGGSSVSTSIHGSEGFRSLIAGFKDAPEMGSPLYGGLINTITRGARLGKFYLGSAPTGGGKTRLMVGDAVNFAVDTIYDKKKKQWIDNGIKEGSLFITTELDETEIQTLVAAFMTDINESLILDGRVTEEQDERLDRAADILEESPFWIEHIPDFSIGEIERIIRRHVRENDVKYISFDYIHTSMKFLAEITKFSNGMKLREDQILFMLSSKLKDLASELGVFIQSATQLNGQWEEAEEINQNLLRGAKSIADRVDIGSIAMKVRAVDEDVVATFVDAGYPAPNYVRHFYKVRRGKFAGTKLWCHADLGTCRVTGLFVTGYDNQPIPIEGMEVKVVQSVKEKRLGQGQKNADIIPHQSQSAF